MADADLFLVGNAGTSTFRKISWANIAEAIKTKLGIGTASELTTSSKNLVGAINEVNAALNGNYVLKAVTAVDISVTTAIAANTISSTVSASFTKVASNAVCVPVFQGGNWLVCVYCNISGNNLYCKYATWSTGSHTSTLSFQVLQFVPVG